MRTVYEISFLGFPTGVYFGILFTLISLIIFGTINKFGKKDVSKHPMLFKIYFLIFIGAGILLTCVNTYNHYYDYYKFHTKNYWIIEGRINNYNIDAKNKESFQVSNKQFFIDDYYKPFSIENGTLKIICGQEFIMMRIVLKYTKWM